MKKTWYEISPDEVSAELGVDASIGLSPEDVKEKREKYGFNTLPEGKKLHWWQLFLRQLINPLVIILIIAAGLTFWIGEYVDMAVIVLAVLVNVLIGFWQEFKSNKIFEKLQKIAKVEARVKRGGKIYDIDASELVPGDIIILKNGAKIPADARVFKVFELEVDESLLTGESVPVKKSVDNISGSVAIGDQHNIVHMGTVIEKGEGLAIVVETGVHTEIGVIAHLTSMVTDESTPLQERLSKLGKIISILVSVIAVLILVVGIFEGRSFVDMFTVAVAVAVAAIPEGLPAALSVILAVAAQKIFKKDGLVKKLISAETLGSTTVICTDKTGTLTEGIMKVEHMLGVKDGEKAIRGLALANEAIVVEENGSFKAKGEVTDRAKMEYFFEKGGNLDATLQEFPRLTILPFEQKDKYIASLHSMSGGKQIIFITGAPEKLLSLSVLSDEEKGHIENDIQNYAERGYRMIAIAEKELSDPNLIDPEQTSLLRESINGLSFIGMVAIRDPIREDVRESTRITRGAGVRIVMVTGDHKLTAMAIGGELGFSKDSFSVMEGDELEKISDEKLADRIRGINIFARVDPGHKMRIVQALKNSGEVVAMTGDGVNDAPALKSADVGIALGSGTDIAKEASDLVLLNDSFSIITSAIRQGRTAFDNMRKVVIFLLIGSFTELILIAASLVLKIPLPITAVMILWANLIEDGFPNFALAFEPGEDDIMTRKPIQRKEPIMNKLGINLVYIQGIVTDLVLVGIFLLLYHYSNYTLIHIQTIIFAALSTDALLIVFSLKNLNKSILKTDLLNNKYLLFAAISGFAAMGFAIYIPVFNWFLGTVPLGIYDVVLVIGLGLFKVVSTEMFKWWFRRSGYFKLQSAV